jgi:RNA polymerase sigma-70 factor (ECF subfamily)
MASPAITAPTLRSAGKTPPAKANMTSQEQDFDLISRLASGDERAVTELYAAYGQRLYAYALRLTGDPAAAEDVTQDTLITAWRTANKFRGEGRLVAWLLGIVHHTAMKALRHPSRPIEAVEETAAEPRPSPEELAQAGEMKHWVRQGLESLSPEHRAALELVFYHGLSLEEAAAVCGCPVGTIKSRLSYARRHLHGVLSRSEEDWR